MTRVVAPGTWVYDGDVHKSVRIIESDRDFWFDVGEANGDLVEGEEPRLNVDGHVYYVLFREDWEPGRPFWPDSEGSLSISDARASAEARVPSSIDWDPAWTGSLLSMSERPASRTAVDTDRLPEDSSAPASRWGVGSGTPVCRWSAPR